MWFGRSMITALRLPTRLLSVALVALASQPTRAADNGEALLPPLRRVFAQGRLAAAEYQQQKASPAGQRSDRMDQSPWSGCVG